MNFFLQSQLGGYDSWQGFCSLLLTLPDPWSVCLTISVGKKQQETSTPTLPTRKKAMPQSSENRSEPRNKVLG